MGFLEYESIALSATTSSGASATSTGTYLGFLHAVQYVAAVGTTAAMSTGGRITLTGDRTGYTLFLLNDISTANDGTYFPRRGTVLSTDAATASTGSAMVPIYNERVTATISSGSTGATRTGTLRLYVV